MKMKTDCILSGIWSTYLPVYTPYPLLSLCERTHVFQPITNKTVWSLCPSSPTWRWAATTTTCPSTLQRRGSDNTPAFINNSSPSTLPHGTSEPQPRALGCKWPSSCTYAITTLNVLVMAADENYEYTYAYIHIYMYVSVYIYNYYSHCLFLLILWC